MVMARRNGNPGPVRDLATPAVMRCRGERVAGTSVDRVRGVSASHGEVSCAPSTVA